MLLLISAVWEKTAVNQINLLNSSRSILGFTKSFRLALVCSLLIAPFTSSSWAQSNPTFSGGGETSLNTTSSPTTVQFGSTQYLLFPNGSGPTTYAASNTTPGSIDYSGAQAVDGAAVTTGPSATVWNGDLYIAYATTGPGIRIDYTSDGSTWHNVAFTISGVPGPSYYGYRPSLVAIGNTLYLAYISSGYVYVVSSTNGTDFANGIEVSDVTTSNSPQLVNFNGTLYVVYTTGSNGNPLVAKLNGNSFTYTIDTAIAIGNSPAAVAYGNTLYIGGVSLSSSNLVMTATNNGVNFNSPTEYGQTLSYSPSFGIFGSYLYECERSNFGSNIWCYVANLN